MLESGLRPLRKVGFSQFFLGLTSSQIYTPFEANVGSMEYPLGESHSLVIFFVLLDIVGEETRGKM